MSTAQVPRDVTKQPIIMKQVDVVNSKLYASVTCSKINILGTAIPTS